MTPGTIPQTTFREGASITTRMHRIAQIVPEYRSTHTAVTMWRCPECPLILVGPQIAGADEHLDKHKEDT